TARARGTSAAGSRPTFILTRGIPSATQPDSWAHSSDSVYEVRPPDPYTGTAGCARPSRSATQTSRSLALRSQSATSTAEIAIAATPGHPRLRTAAIIAHHAAGTASASRPRTAFVRVPVTSEPTDASP